MILKRILTQKAQAGVGDLCLKLFHTTKPHRLEHGYNVKIPYKESGEWRLRIAGHSVGFTVLNCTYYAEFDSTIIKSKEGSRYVLQSNLNALRPNDTIHLSFEGDSIMVLNILEQTPVEEYLAL